MFMGRQLHRTLEAYYRRVQLGVPVDTHELIQEQRATWIDAATEEDVLFGKAEDCDRLRDKAASLAEKYFEFAASEDCRPLAVETPLHVPLVDPDNGEDLGVPMFGIVDLVHDEEDGPVICDFKSTGRSGNASEIVHAVQLGLYSYAVRSLTGVDEAACEIRQLVTTKVPKISVLRFPSQGEQRMRRLFRIVRAYLDDLDSGRFVHRPGWTCASCEFIGGPCNRA